MPGSIPARKGLDEAGYKDEFYQNEKAVKPSYWSPNRILLEGLNPIIPVVVNINPGSPWYNNGKQLFPQNRIVEMRKPFEVMPNEKGVVELTYRHQGHKLGILGTIMLLAISSLVVFLYEKKK